MTASDSDWLDKALQSFRAQSQWSADATENEKTLVACNLNGFVGHLRALTRSPAEGEGVVVPRERTPKDYAIEFGEYMAVAAINYMETSAHERFPDADVLRDRLRALGSAVYEFRKRAARAAALTPAPQAQAEEGAKA